MQRHQSVFPFIERVIGDQRKIHRGSCEMAWNPRFGFHQIITTDSPKFRIALDTSEIFDELNELQIGKREDTDSIFHDSGRIQIDIR